MTWLLIDGNNWYARDFFASSDSAAGNFLKRLADLRSQIAHSRVAIAWDSTSFRHELSEGYKAKRASKPDGFKAELAALRNSLAGLEGVTSFAVDGFEADDLLASLARNALDEGEKAVIFSSDRDLHQCLVRGLVSQVTAVSRLKPGTLSFVAMTSDKLWTEFGVAPHQWVDYRTMTGDSSDCISGCAGIGPKAAAEVLQKSGSLDVFFERPFTPSLSARQRNLLLEFRPRVELLRRMVTLVDSVPLPAAWLQGVML
jgi:DNA polymerase I